MTFRRILVATDGGQAAEWATDAGASMAAQLHAKLAFVHVIPRALAYPTELGFVESDRIADLHERADHYLCHAQRRAGDVPSERIMREGIAPAEIIVAAKEWNADLIVVGSHNRGRFSRLILGSTAEAIVRGANCPVLVMTQAPTQAADEAIAAGELASV
ncbi:MAG TPA: universal stress protein [Tepidisphaeraceae bacterium]|jgi:nucleotide-binding universal stress UspA family protein|nr:universal stress protein [Tepidisphaeraceae bacterium]